MFFSFLKKISGKKQRPEGAVSFELPMQFVLNYSEGHERTSLVSEEEIERAINNIDEYGDIRLIPQNLELLINLANDYIKTSEKQSMKIIIEFVKNLRPMIIDKNTIWVSGD